MKTLQLKRVLKLIPILFCLLGLVPVKGQISNGGFETGNFTGYTTSNANVVSSIKHWGSYSARIGEPVGDLYSAGHVIHTNINEEVDDIDKFVFYLIHDDDNVKVKIRYTDDTRDEFLYYWNEAGNDVWHSHTIFNGAMTDGKTIDKIEIYRIWASEYYVYVDDLGFYYPCIPPYC